MMQGSLTKIDMLLAGYESNQDSDKTGCAKKCAVGYW